MRSAEHMWKLSKSPVRDQKTGNSFRHTFCAPLNVLILFKWRDIKIKIFNGCDAASYSSVLHTNLYRGNWLIIFIGEKSQSAAHSTLRFVEFSVNQVRAHLLFFNPLTPNDHYSGRTAPLTSKRSILYIYSTNIGTEYFKHGIYSPFFSLFKMQFVS